VGGCGAEAAGVVVEVGELLTEVGGDVRGRQMERLIVSRDEDLVALRWACAAPAPAAVVIAVPAAILRRRMQRVIMSTRWRERRHPQGRRRAVAEEQMLLPPPPVGIGR